MLSILNFFEETNNENTTPTNGWVTWIIFGVILVGLILLMIIPQRKQRKKAEEMMAQLGIGSFVTTIGGIVGEVVQMNDTHIWIETGLDGSKVTMQFLRQAIHSIAPAPGSAEAIAEEKAERKEANEEDEIK